MRAAIAAVLLCGFPLTAFAQAQPDVAEILKKVAETYTNAREYELDVEITERGPRAAQALPTHAKFYFRAPGKYRMEGLPGTTPGDPRRPGQVVSDGSTVWLYSPMANEYTAIPPSELERGAWKETKPEAVDHFMMARYRAAADDLASSRLLRQESINVNGVPADCYVFEMGKIKATWWIDKRTYFILREDTASSSLVFTTIKVNEPLSDEFFTFVPPAGAKKSD